MPDGARSFASSDSDIGWQDYEELVRDIYQALGQANGVTIECWGSSCRVEGPPGVFHQIDVLTSHSDGLHHYKTAISCKNWKKKVGIPIVREFAQIVQDGGLSKGVMVSKMGFTGPAKTYAESKNIGLVELRRPLDEDWNGYIRAIHIVLTIDLTQIDDVEFELTAPPPGPDEEALRGGPVYWPLMLNQVFIGTSGREAETLQSLADAEMSNRPDEEEYHLQFPPDSTVSIPDYPEHPAHGYSITGVRFKVKYNPPMTEEIVIRAGDHIYMIMESLFDGRRFTITKDGEIRENM